MGAEKALASSFVMPSNMTIVSLLHFCAVVQQQRATRFTSFLDNLGLRRRFRIRTCRATISGSAGFAMARMLPQKYRKLSLCPTISQCRHSIHRIRRLIHTRLFSLSFKTMSIGLDAPCLYYSPSIGSATYRVDLHDIAFCFVELACWRRSVNRGHTLHRR